MNPFDGMARKLIAALAQEEAGIMVYGLDNWLWMLTQEKKRKTRGQEPIRDHIREVLN